MDGHHRKDTTHGLYTVNINGIEIEFYEALLAPPSGVMSTNYSRYVVIMIMITLLNFPMLLE